MLDLLYYIGAAVVGGVAGYFIGSAIAKYLDKAKDWFNEVWHSLSKAARGVGLLVKHGNRLFKHFIAELRNGEIEEYGATDDEGIEIDWNDLSDEAKKALCEDEYLVISSFES